MKDKRDECGCHRECDEAWPWWQPGGQRTLTHVCSRRCEWPSCLTDVEEAELVDELIREGL